jgi:hypothetical protein
MSLDEPADSMSTAGYRTAWLRAFLARASGLAFDEVQAERTATLAERKLVDLFDVAEETAAANGRERILRHDLPLTKGLRALLGEVDTFAREIELRPLLALLADAGVPGPLDELVRAEIPRLMAALLLVTGRVIVLVNPESMSTQERLDRFLRRPSGQPTEWDIERAGRVVNLIL